MKVAGRAALEAIKTEIDDRTRRLSDREYLEVLQEVCSYADSCADAKRDDLALADRKKR